MGSLLIITWLIVAFVIASILYVLDDLTNDPDYVFSGAWGAGAYFLIALFWPTMVGIAVFISPLILAGYLISRLGNWLKTMLLC